MRCASSISAAVFNVGPRPIRVPLSRCEPPHSEFSDGRCSRMMTAGFVLADNFKVVRTVMEDC